MEYLLVMSLSGSAMTGIYLLLRFLLRKRVCARLYDLLARVAILYYLVPLLISLIVRQRQPLCGYRASVF